MVYAKYKSKNNAQGQLDGGISASAVSLVLQTGQGELFPSSGDFLITAIQYDTENRVAKREIIKCTNRTGDILTIVRSAGYCPANYSALTQTNTAFAFDSGDYIYQYPVSEMMDDMQDEIERLETDKADDSAVVHKTGTETINGTKTFGSFPITPSASPTTDYQVVNKKYLDNSLAQISTLIDTKITGEDILANDALVLESHLNDLSDVDVNFGDTAGTEKIYFTILSKGETISSIGLKLKESGTPTDNLNVRIETVDANHRPTGTLADVDATATILNASITGSDFITATFAGDVTLIDQTCYAIVISRAGSVDGGNYFQLGMKDKGNVSLQYGFYDGSDYDTNNDYQYNIDGMSLYNSFLVGGNTEDIDYMNFVGFSNNVFSKYDDITYETQGVVDGFNDLILDSQYFMKSLFARTLIGTKSRVSDSYKTLTTGTGVAESSIIYQSIQFAEDIVVDEIDSLIQITVGSIDYDLTVRIETDTAGAPSGTLVDANATKTTNYVDGAGTYTKTQAFAGNISLSKNTKYWLKWSASANSGGNTRHCKLAYNSTDVYANGNMAHQNTVPSGSYTVDATRDVRFALNVISVGENSSNIGSVDTQTISYDETIKGGIDTTPGTYRKEVGLAVDVDKLLIKNLSRKAIGTSGGSATVTIGFYPKIVMTSVVGGGNSYLDEQHISNKTQTGFDISGAYDWVALG